MATRPVPERLRWAVDRLDLRAGHRVLEIGCGNGVAVALICAVPAVARVVAVDRSATALRAAAQRNAAQVAAGRAVFRHADLSTLDSSGERYDRILAVNVNLFWTRPPTAEFRRLAGLLAPDGVLHLVYEPPHPARLAPLVDRLTDRVGAAGWTVAEIARVDRPTPLLGVVARPA
ncbi:SAM-dependent methyltransferase [Micromonospora sp. NPDC048063]|uniref:SAM-dependent methyltransferase n=1 Tax=Micromonospora sp. NPDC048063 TaxID=3364256 RepID=UPI0037203F77